MQGVVIQGLEYLESSLQGPLCLDNQFSLSTTVLQSVKEGIGEPHKTPRVFVRENKANVPLIRCPVKNALKYLLMGVP